MPRVQETSYDILFGSFQGSGTPTSTNGYAARTIPVAEQVLHQVLLELLRNAITAIGPGRTGRITISTTATRTGFACQVSDTGTGLSAEKMTALSEPATVQSLGLLLVHQAAGRWGG